MVTITSWFEVVVIALHCKALQRNLENLTINTSKWIVQTKLNLTLKSENNFRNQNHNQYNNKHPTISLLKDFVEMEIFKR